MKKLLFISMFALLVSSLTFAAAKSTSSSGNGNGGKDKIGGYIGLRLAYPIHMNLMI